MMTWVLIDSTRGALSVTFRGGYVLDVEGGWSYLSFRGRVFVVAPVARA